MVFTKDNKTKHRDAPTLSHEVRLKEGKVISRRNSVYKEEL